MKNLRLHRGVLPALSLLFAWSFTSVHAFELPGTNAFYVISKTRTYYQTNSAAPVPDCQAPFCFFQSASADEAIVTVTSAETTVPDSTIGDPVVPLEPATVVIGETVLENVFRSLDCLRSQAQLDAEFPDGVYTGRMGYRITLAEGSTTNFFQFSLPLSGQVVPNTPTFINLLNPQAIPANSAFTLQWQPFANPVEFDAAGLLIFECTNSVGPCTNCIGPLIHQIDVAATNPAPSAVIPAGLLQPGRSYEAQLVFDRWNAVLVDVQTNIISFDILGIPFSIPIPTRMLARTSEAKLTRLPLRIATGTVPPPPPRFTLTSAAGETPLQFNLATVSGNTYRIQSSPDLKTWTTVLTTNAAGASVAYEDSSPPRSARYFRALTP